MSNVILLPAVLVLLLSGGYAAVRHERCHGKGRALASAEKRNRCRQLALGAEDPALLSGVEFALESCLSAQKQGRVFHSGGDAAQLLDKLMAGQLDVVLLSEGQDAALEEEYATLRVPYDRKADGEGPAADAGIRVIWKNDSKSKLRDKFIFALEERYFRLNCAYADYLE